MAAPRARPSEVNGRTIAPVTAPDFRPLAQMSRIWRIASRPVLGLISCAFLVVAEWWANRGRHAERNSRARPAGKRIGLSYTRQHPARLVSATGTRTPPHR